MSKYLHLGSAIGFSLDGPKEILIGKIADRWRNTNPSTGTMKISMFPPLVDKSVHHYTEQQTVLPQHYVYIMRVAKFILFSNP